MKHKRRSAALPLFVLASIWGAAIVIVNPIGNFPLNDDFSFARSVFNLSERGILLFDDWLDMTLITQVLWGAGFTKIFGFSFNVLRASNLVASFLAMCGCYRIAQDLGHSRQTSLLAALSTGFSPILFSLSFTFMSDVPFFALVVWSVWAYNRALASGQMWYVLLGSALAIAATFIRQLGLMLPAAFVLAWLFRPGGLFKKGKMDWKNLFTAALPFTITTLLYVRYNQWFEASQGLPESYGHVSRLFKRLGSDGLWWESFRRIGILAGYLGVFLLPLVLVLKKWRIWQKGHSSKLGLNGAQRTACALLIGGCVAALIPAWDETFWGNIFYDLGLGPKVLKDGQFFMNVRPQLDDFAEGTVKTFFSLSGILLIFSVLPQFFVKLKKGSPHFLPAIFAGANIVLYGGFLLLDLKFFDRYFIQLLPFLLVFLLPPVSQAGRQIPEKFSRRSSWAATAALLLIATFSITATHDYLSWNRARWQALDHLTEELKISPDDIDGGFEFNGWHRPVTERSSGPGKSWWWVKNDDWAVTFGDMDGHRKVKGFPYVRYLPPGVDSVFILHKN